MFSEYELLDSVVKKYKFLLIPDKKTYRVTHVTLLVNAVSYYIQSLKSIAKLPSEVKQIMFIETFEIRYYTCRKRHVAAWIISGLQCLYHHVLHFLMLLPFVGGLITSLFT
jgi:hypothetical protein